ncbi:hypothetical protein FJ492_17620 [Mesorhizobium sp. B2-5-4]|uniref:hypothetical protein n=1 Tax=unclassified Mesorhizobium TaxID=325217 RepID=UPI00112C3E89|nr:MULTISPECIES: hypothetical protein [unclassified Mesorhizobium]TPK42151.1 hypothetical protein FJ492_17620 [Mesorhizobium sp. B2-5-4]TPL71870.1 hypothetical protein FJ941_28405 [Mesorhizobium sp. B2-3-13]
MTKASTNASNPERNEAALGRVLDHMTGAVLGPRAIRAFSSRIGDRIILLNDPPAIECGKRRCVSIKPSIGMKAARSRE